MLERLQLAKVGAFFVSLMSWEQHKEYSDTSHFCTRLQLLSHFSKICD